MSKSDVKFSHPPSSGNDIYLQQQDLSLTTTVAGSVSEVTTILGYACPAQLIFKIPWNIFHVL